MSWSVRGRLFGGARFFVESGLRQRRGTRTLTAGGVWRRSLRKSLQGLLLATLTLAAADGRATPPTLQEQDRGVFTRSSSIEPPSFDEAVDPDEAVDFTPFSASVVSDTSTVNASADASAGIVSDLDGSELTVSGTATALASSSGADSRGEAPADSLFEVVFEAAASEPFTLLGSVEASASSGDAFASVVLRDLDAELDVSSHQASPGESVPISASGMLQAGNQYRLTAFGLAYALSEASAGSVSGSASYQATLSLPEPSRELCLATGLIALALLARQRRRRRSR